MGVAVRSTPRFILASTPSATIHANAVGPAGVRGESGRANHMEMPDARGEDGGDQTPGVRQGLV